MKKLTILIILFYTQLCVYGQTTRTAVSTNQYAPYVYTTVGTDNKVKKSIDSLAVVLRAEMIAGDAANKKALADSMKLLLPIDGVTIVALNGKTSANFTPINNSIAALDVRVKSLEGWRTETNIELVKINVKVATIPTKANSTTTTTSVSTTTTTLSQ